MLKSKRLLVLFMRICGILYLYCGSKLSKVLYKYCRKAIENIISFGRLRIVYAGIRTTKGV